MQFTEGMWVYLTMHRLWEEQIILASVVSGSPIGLIPSLGFNINFSATTFFSFLFHQHVQGPGIMCDTQQVSWKKQTGRKHSVRCLNSWNFCLLLVLRDNSANFMFCLKYFSCSMIYNQIKELQMWADIIAVVFIGFKVGTFINTTKIQNIQKSNEDAFFFEKKEQNSSHMSNNPNYYNQSRGIWTVFS